MTDVLLTGANGQLGWEVAHRAAAAGLSCHAVDRGALDITDADAVTRMIAVLRPAVVINAAAYTAVDRAESDEAAAFAVNRDGPAYLAEACAAGGVTLVHVSTDYVFDGAKQSAYTEEDPVAPLGVYGASKLAGEEAIRRLCPQHIIVRAAWIYGIHGQNFVQTMLRLAREHGTVRVVDDQRGGPTFAGDLADAILELAVRLRDGRMTDNGFGTFHCVNKGVTTWYGLARKIFEITASVLERIPTVEGITTAEYRTPARRPVNSVLDCSRLSRVHGLTLRPWEAALAEMLGAVMAREDKAANLVAPVDEKEDGS